MIRGFQEHLLEELAKALNCDQTAHPDCSLCHLFGQWPNHFK